MNVIKNGQSVNALLDAEETDKSELITRTEIENSPFVIVGVEGEYFGTLGKYRLTESYSSEEEATEATKEMTWNRIVQVMMLIAEELKETNINELTKKQ